MATDSVFPETQAGVTPNGQSKGDSKMKPLPPRNAPSFRELLDIALDAMRIYPPLYVSSFLGHPWKWLPPQHPFSEYRILDLWKLGGSLKYLFNISFPSIPRRPLDYGPPFLENFFWRPTVILQRPDHNGSYTSFPDESWFFVNGIMTNDAVAQINAAYLAYLFHRPLTLIQNSTNSFAFDLLQCAVGKEWQQTTEEAVKSFPPIYDALKSPDKKKVVVIAHSQGTIIMSIVIRLLVEMTKEKALEIPPAEGMPAGLAGPELFAPPVFIYPEDEILELKDFTPLEWDELAKLEVYCFANCANRMNYFPQAVDGKRIPWIESYGNENDAVARLGMLAPNYEKRDIDIDGPRYLQAGAWGHLLNEHYLRGIEAKQKQGRKRGGRGGCAPFCLINAYDYPQDSVPRLYSYLNGGSPD